MGKWETIEDILTPEGIDKLRPGQVLVFSYEGSPLHLKIKRKSKGRVWAERIHLYSEEEIAAMQKGYDEDSQVRQGD